MMWAEMGGVGWLAVFLFIAINIVITLLVIEYAAWRIGKHVARQLFEKGRADAIERREAT